MADFVAVLRKTLSGLDDPAPEMRQKVYAKARATIAAKLDAIDPKPPQSVIDRQMAALEKAIIDIEAGYAPTASGSETDEDPLAEFVSGAAFGTQPTPVPEPAVQPADPTPPPTEPVSSSPGPIDPEAVVAKVAAKENTNGTSEKSAGTNGAKRSEREGKRGRGWLIAAAVVLLLLAGAGYAVWQNKEDFARMAGLEHMLAGPDSEAAGQEDQTAGGDTSEGTEQAATDTASGSDASSTGTDAQGEPTEEGEAKFTQRLMEDGSEVDAGPAGNEPTVGEGTSVAAATPPADDGAANAGQGDPAATDADNSETGAAAPEGTALPVGQRAIFYEERTSDLQGSAQAGAVLWSVVQESPGGNLPPEAAVRAEATIPGKDIQFRMTIRRNSDETLPASHIIEMIFITPDDFDGGAIENVLRIAFKDSEQSAGNPLLGIPAKISDGFFLLALTDSKADIEANTTMMRRLEWLDVPIVYSSGRRALITLEKGVPGSKAFDEALNAWATSSSG